MAKRLAAALVTIVSVSCLAQTSSRVELCPATEIKFSTTLTDVPVVVESLHFLTQSGSSKGWIVLKNGGTEPIDVIYALVEFRHEGNYLLTMPFYASEQDRTISLPPPAPVSIESGAIQTMHSTFLPGDKLAVNGFSSLLALSCPDEAHIAVLEAGFRGHKKFFYAAPDWRSDASLQSATPIPFQFAPKPLPGVVLAKISIDPKGTPSVTVFGGWDVGVQRWIEERVVPSWTLFPSFYRGQPVTSELSVAFLFQEQKGGPPLAETNYRLLKARTVVLIGMGHPKINNLKSVVTWGGVPLGSQ